MPSDDLPDATIHVGREGPMWVAAALIETPWGPVLLTSCVSEHRVRRLLKARFSANPPVGFSFNPIKAIKKAARKIAKSSVVRSITRQVKNIANNPIVKAAIRLHTAPLKLAKNALKGVTNNPLWKIAATGASFIPGIGSAVSAGMAAASALGRGMSLKDAALAAAKNALPGGPMAAAAFDVAMGLAHGQRIDQAALSAARNQLPGGPLAKAGFDTALQVIKTKSVRGVPALAAKLAVENAGKGPMWDKLASGARIIPGLGVTASAGMAGAVALGRRAAAANMPMALAASRLPGGAVAKAAFAAGVGIGKARHIDVPGLNKVRAELPQTASAKAAFNLGLALSRGKPGDAKTVRAIATSMPKGAVGRRVTRLAAAAVARQRSDSESKQAGQAARQLMSSVREGDPAARERFQRIIVRAREGDRAARLAVQILRRTAGRSAPLLADGALRAMPSATDAAPPIPTQEVIDTEGTGVDDVTDVAVGDEFSGIDADDVMAGTEADDVMADIDDGVLAGEIEDAVGEPELPLAEPA